VRARIPDPSDPATFARAKLDWSEAAAPGHRERRALYRELLGLRRRHIVPRLAGMRAPGTFAASDRAGLAVHWTLGDGAHLHLVANLSAVAADGVAPPAGEVIYARGAIRDRSAAPWSVTWTLEAAA
jgi:1,4-alpha-glucan branching enzyme